VPSRLILDPSSAVRRVPGNAVHDRRVFHHEHMLATEERSLPTPRPPIGPNRSTVGCALLRAAR
jgi:hypothetical protein